MNKKINIDKDHYYTQRNNPQVVGDNPDIEGDKDFILNANSQCMPTSYVMFLIGNKIEYVNPTGKPDDAYFAELLVAKEAWKFAKKKYPSLIENGYSPNEIHGMYGSYLSPVVCGKRVSDFVSNLTFEDYVSRILSGQVIMTSGRFRGIIGHAFVIMGIIDDHLSLADPWGDYRTDYVNKNGYAVSMDREDFITHVKPIGKERKWGHIII